MGRDDADGLFASCTGVDERLDLLFERVGRPFVELPCDCRMTEHGEPRLLYCFFYLFERALNPRFMMVMQDFPDPRALVDHIIEVFFRHLENIGLLHGFHRGRPWLACQERYLSEEIAGMESGQIDL